MKIAAAVFVVPKSIPNATLFALKSPSVSLLPFLEDALSPVVAFAEAKQTHYIITTYSTVKIDFWLISLGIAGLIVSL